MTGHYSAELPDALEDRGPLVDGERVTMTHPCDGGHDWIEHLDECSRCGARPWWWYVSPRAWWRSWRLRRAVKRAIEEAAASGDLADLDHVDHFPPPPYREEP